MLVAVLVGTVCGAGLIMCVLNRCQRSKSERLAKAKNLFQYDSSNPTTDAAIVVTNAPIEAPGTDDLEKDVPVVDSIETEEDFGNTLTSRGLVFTAPKERRQTTK